MQQIKLMEEMQRKASEKERRREEKKIRKQKVCAGDWDSSKGFVDFGQLPLGPPTAVLQSRRIFAGVASSCLAQDAILFATPTLRPRCILSSCEAQPPQAKPEWITSMVEEMSECIEFRPSEEEFNGDPLREDIPPAALHLLGVDFAL